MAKEISELLVVSDVDGTLLQAGYGIPRENIEALERFTAKGGRFTVCTGRSMVSVRRYVDWLQMTAPAILNNGAVIYDYEKEQVVYASELKESIVVVIREILETFPDVGVELHSVRDIVVVRQNEYADRHTAVEHLPVIFADMDTVKGPWTKVLFATSPQRVLQIEKFARDKLKTDPIYRDFDFIATSENYFEVLHKGINKGTGLKKLAELLRVEIADTVAVGDYYNDIDMLEAAGYAAVVADAPAEVRAVADVTVKPCLQGGVAELLDSLDLLCDDFVQLKLDL